MKVIFVSAQIIGNRKFTKGPQDVSPNLSGNQKFKQLVKAGQIIMGSRGPDAQSLQAQKDAQNKVKAEKARQLTKELHAAKEAGALPHEVAGIAKPSLAPAMAAHHAAKTAPKIGV